MSEALRRRIDEIVGSQIHSSGPRSAVVGVRVPRCDFEHTAAAGIARADTNRPASGSDRFHVASVGKMFTAVLITRAASEGRFGPRGVDAVLSEIDAIPRDLVAAIHPEGHSISLRHLLTHTSGMKDNVVDDATGTASELGSPPPGSLISRYTRSVAAIRNGRTDDGFARHRWKPWDPDHLGEPMVGTLNDFITSGTAANPVALPGEKFHYSDTAFVLLGVVLELVTGRRYHELQREQILNPLGLVDTTMAYCETTSSVREGEMDVWFGSVPLVSEGFDLSFDWGGGGQVSTVADLLTFLAAVLDPASGIISPRFPLTQWSEPAGLSAPRRGVGLGLLQWEAGGRVVTGHAGAWGVRVFHDPQTDAWLAGTVNEQNACAWMADIFAAVEQELR